MDLLNLDIPTKTRRSRLGEKLRKQEYYAELEELFDPLTKTINNNNEKNSSIAIQTVEALEDNTNTFKALEISYFLQSVFSKK